MIPQGLFRRFTKMGNGNDRPHFQYQCLTTIMIHVPTTCINQSLKERFIPVSHSVDASNEWFSFEAVDRRRRSSFTIDAFATTTESQSFYIHLEMIQVTAMTFSDGRNMSSFPKLRGIIGMIIGRRIHMTISLIVSNDTEYRFVLQFWRTVIFATSRIVARMV